MILQWLAMPVIFVGLTPLWDDTNQTKTLI
ncbi:MAG: hypothetical protein ACI9EW_003071 [Cellvibrionaceae bacterium]|jgi:hypothetical protein